MSRERDIAMQYAKAIEEQRFGDAFGLMAESGTYTVIGTTPISKTYPSKTATIAELGAALSRFKEPPRVKFDHVIVDGDRAVLLGAGRGVGPAGRYDQPFYAFSLRIVGAEIVEIIEFLDTMMLSTALYGEYKSTVA
jgi:ketosteroid isomerase-like protein